MKQKIFDAHFHVGYFPRKDEKGGEAYYYSPARIMQYIHWAGIDEFIVSSTNACWDTHATNMHLEAIELKRLAGNQCHPFFWLTRDYLHWDCHLEKIPEFYEGLKLHGAESHWTEHPKELCYVLSFAKDRHLPVQIHTGKDKFNSCSIYIPFCQKYPSLNFDLAHGWPLNEALEAVKICPNVWIDTAFTKIETIQTLLQKIPEKIMFGSDFPAPLRFYQESGTRYLRKCIATASTTGDFRYLYQNSVDFMGRRCKT